MTSLFSFAGQFQEFLISQNWQYCFIGGIALQRWGQPRLTNDIDVTVLAGFGNESHYADALLSTYDGRLPDAREFAINNRVLLLQSSDGIPIDVSLGGIALEEEIIRRSSPYEFLPDIILRTCSAEDLVVLKAFADRNRDWADIETVIERQVCVLDWDYIQNQLQALSEIPGKADILKRLTKLRDIGDKNSE
jgi:hypothetical protein